MKKALSLILALMLVLGLAACGGNSGGNSGSGDATDYSAITADPATKTIKTYAEVNGQYFNQITRHGVVFADGANGDKAVLRGLCSEKDFYQALLNIGAVPGDNLTVADAGGIIDGAKLDVTVSWDGSDGEIPFADCIKTGSGEPYQLDARFGGNIKAAYEYNTGCILCLDSCPVGIVSNAAYGFGSIEKDHLVDCYGNEEVLPADGTVVTVTYTLLD